MPKMKLVFTRDEIERNIPYAMICESRYGSSWDTMRRKRAWKFQFTESEQRTADKLFKLAHTWYLVKGLPDEYEMTFEKYELWGKIARFCAEL